MTSRKEGSTRLYRFELEKLGLHKHHPFYMGWVNMKTRCSNPTHQSYKYYGGRGIIVCSRWLIFRNYYEDLFSNWGEGLSLDRIDTNGNYEPENVRWVPWHLQATNRNPKGYLNGLHRLC